MAKAPESSLESMMLQKNKPNGPETCKHWILDVITITSQKMIDKYTKRDNNNNIHLYEKLPGLSS